MNNIFQYCRRYYCRGHSINQLTDSVILNRNQFHANVVIVNACRTSENIKPVLQRKVSGLHRTKLNKMWKGQELLQNSSQNSFLADPDKILMVNGHGSVCSKDYIQNESNTFFILTPKIGKILYNNHVN